MTLQSPQIPDGRPGASDPDRRVVSDECLLVRNYDGDEHCDVTVTFRDANDGVAFRRSFGLAPLDVISVSSRLERGVYLVTARRDGDHAARAECLAGSGPAETALVEVGNGLVSVTEGPGRFVRMEI